MRVRWSHTRLFIVLARFVLRDEQLYLTEMAYLAFLGPDMVDLISPSIVRGDSVDALAECIDTNQIASVCDACVAFDC